MRGAPGVGGSHCRLHFHSPSLLFPTQAVFTLLLGPFTFFDVQKTKYLQILTSLMRWIGESEDLTVSALLAVPSSTSPERLGKLPAVTGPRRWPPSAQPAWSSDLCRGRGEGSCPACLSLVGKLRFF